VNIDAELYSSEFASGLCFSNVGIGVVLFHEPGVATVLLTRQYPCHLPIRKLSPVD
jgi:hypothetical protein